MAFSQDWSGQQINDYRLLRRLGAGSFGEVYLADDLREHRQVALKLIKSPLTEREDLKAFLNEARSIRLQHPHIVPLFDFGLSEQDLPFLVMEYMTGGTIRKQYPKGQRVPLEDVVRLVAQLASALQYAHDRYQIHRDVKPENMLSRSDNMVLLSDFGIASVAHASNSADIQQVYGGTLPYMAPEQHAGQPRPASDQYALAVVCYEWLTGARPFQGTVSEIISQHIATPPRSLRPQNPMVPPAVEQVIFKALAKAYKDRFYRVQDFADALKSASQSAQRPAETIVLSHASLSDATEATAPDIIPQSPQQAIDRDAKVVLVEPLGDASDVVSLVHSDPPGGEQDVEETIRRSPTSSTDTDPQREPDIAGPQRTKQPDTPSSMPPPVPGSSRRTGRRGRTFVLVGLALLVVLGLGAGGLWYVRLTTTAPPVTSNMFGFDATHTHDDPDEHTIGVANVSRLITLWSYRTGGVIASSPAVADGLVYIGSNDHSIYAFDANCRQSCLPLWSFKTGDAISSSPAVAGGLVYIGSGDGKLYAFDASCRSACQPLWSFNTGAAISSSPTVAGGMVYIGSETGMFYAFDAACRGACQPLWSFYTGSIALSSPAVGGRMVYIGTGAGKLYAFDAFCQESCQPLWSFDFKKPIYASPAVAGGLVYIDSSDGSFYAFDNSCRSFCQPLWGFATGAELASSPAVAGGLVYVGSYNKKLYAFDASCRLNCQPLWTFSTDGAIVSSPTIANGVVYVGSRDNLLYAFDASCRRNCQPLWTTDVGSSIDSSPMLTNGVIYVGSNDHKFYAFGLST